MKINGKMSVMEIKAQFRELFPLLKIEFYNKKHAHFKGSKSGDEINEALVLSKLNPDIKNGIINIDENMTVDEFETIMEKDFGLHVQVFRKSGDQWLQTSITDNWTLDKQEKKAEAISKYLAK